MTILAFIFLSFIITIILFILNLYKSGLKPFHLPLAALCLLFSGASFYAFNLYPISLKSFLGMKLFVAFSFVATCCNIDLIKNFFKYHIVENDSGNQKKTNRTLLWRIVCVFAGIACFFIADSDIGILKGNEIFVMSDISIGIFYIQLFLQAYILFIIESIFRFATTHQRRIGRLFLLSLIIIALYQCVFLVRCVIYKTILYPYLIAYIVIIGICFPIMLLGLFRIRIGSYEVGISRRTIYSSISIFAFGAFCLAVGSASLIAKKLSLEFSFFEVFLLLFAAFFFGILVLLSEDMRKRIRLFVNNNIFIRKFDYREQFFWLHQSYMVGEDVNESITILTEHLLYTLNYDNIYIFLNNNSDGNYYLHGNLKTSLKNEYVITGDNQIITEFLHDKRPLEFKGINFKQRERDIAANQREMIENLGITAIFPIFHKETLLGLLAVKYRHPTRLDVEDKMLISIFTISIGNVFFKYHMLKEKIENKQFESFNHLSAFLVHDIKNQVATLSLLLKNASKNLNNPDFQQSLLISISNCANNLQKLVDKFTVPPKSDQIHSQMEDINAIVNETIAAMGLSALQGVTVTSVIQASCKVAIDRESLLFILKNLIINALEAMKNKGTLTIVTGNCNAFTKKLQKEFNISEQFLRKRRVYISVEDTGIGMSKEFIEQQLFLPFSTTKDKGIGIGLYQCKTLIEKMNGALLCASSQNVGTKFCILL